MVWTVKVKQVQSLPLGNFDPVHFGHVPWTLVYLLNSESWLSGKENDVGFWCVVFLLLFVPVSAPQSISNVSAFIWNWNQKTGDYKIVICELLFSKVSFEVETKDLKLTFSPFDCNLYVAELIPLLLGKSSKNVTKYKLILSK